MDATNLKKLVDVLADTANVVEKVVADQGNLLTKLSHLVPLSGDAILLAGVDWKALKAEVSALDAAGKQALLDEFKGKFDIADDAIEAKVEEALALAISLEDMIEKIVMFGKSLAAKPAQP